MTDMLDLPTPRILTVTELTRSIRGILETEFPFITVSGEISNLRQPHSGHYYFTLKDDAAQIRAVLFKPQLRYLREHPEDGLQVICRGRISVYEPRGEYQIIIDYLERSGRGELQAAFEKLKHGLSAEGLFSQERKKKLPLFPARIALVTSPEGAALFDFLKVALHRCPSQAIEIFPVRVQGAEAAREISQAIEAVNRRRRSDVVVLCRGGGSIEDLWPFNEEMVARAIFASEIPVVSAVGHEIDFTIADFVADLRAPTPASAAEIIVPSRQALTDHVLRLKNALIKSVAGTLKEAGHRVALHQRMLGDPRSLITHNMLHLDNVFSALTHNYKSYLHSRAIRLGALSGRLHMLSPVQQLTYKQQWRGELARRLQRAMLHRIDQKRSRLQAANKLLDAIGPPGVLNRGYAVVRSAHREKHAGEVIRSIRQVSIGRSIEVILQEGRLGGEVTRIEEDGRDERI